MSLFGIVRSSFHRRPGTINILFCTFTILLLKYIDNQEENTTCIAHEPRNELHHRICSARPPRSSFLHWSYRWSCRILQTPIWLSLPSKSYYQQSISIQSTRGLFYFSHQCHSRNERHRRFATHRDAYRQQCISSLPVSGFVRVWVGESIEYAAVGVSIRGVVSTGAVDCIEWLQVKKLIISHMTHRCIDIHDNVTLVTRHSAHMSHMMMHTDWRSVVSHSSLVNDHLTLHTHISCDPRSSFLSDSQISNSLVSSLWSYDDVFYTCYPYSCPVSWSAS